MSTPKTALEQIDLRTEVARSPVPEILQPGDLEKHAASLKDEELLSHLKTAFSGVRDTLQRNLPYLLDARNRFAKPGRRLPVEGKPTWTQWVKANLQVDVRTVQRWLAAPKTKALPPKKKKQLRPVEPFEDWPDAMRKTNDLVAAVKRLQAKTPVNGADMLIPALRELAAIAGCQLIEPTVVPEPTLEPSTTLSELQLCLPFRKTAMQKGADDKVSDPERAKRDARKKEEEQRLKVALAKNERDTDTVAAQYGYVKDGNGKSFFAGKKEMP